MLILRAMAEDVTGTRLTIVQKAWPSLYAALVGVLEKAEAMNAVYDRAIEALEIQT